MGFDVRHVDPTYTGRSTTLIPRGTYRLEIVSAEERVSRNSGDSQYVEFGISVLEPEEFSGQFFYQNVTTKNKNPKAQQMGDRMMSAIGNAIGLLEGEYQDLCHKSFVAMVEIEKGDTNPSGGMWPDKNKLDRVYWEEGSAPKGLGPMGAPPTAVEPIRPAPVAVARPAAVAGSGGRPWLEKRA